MRNRKDEDSKLTKIVIAIILARYGSNKPRTVLNKKSPVNFKER